MDISRRSFLYSLSLIAQALGMEGSLEGLGVLFSGPKKEAPPIRRENLFKAEGKSLVSTVGGRDLKAMIRKSVSLIGGFDKLDLRGKTVLVKPNVVAARRNPTTTNPGVVKAVTSILYEEGASKVYVGDMSALMRLPTSKNMDSTGIRKAAAEAGAEVIHFEDHGWIRVKTPQGRYLTEVGVTEWMFKADRIINLPVIKTHRSATYSICLKNFVGATHFRQRPYFVNVRHWEEVISEINLAYTPDLNIVDGTRIMIEGGPWKGGEAETNLIISSGDRVAADAVGLALIKSFGIGKGVAALGVWEQRQIKRAVELGLGARGIDGMTLVTHSFERGFEGLFERIKQNLI